MPSRRPKKVSRSLADLGGLIKKTDLSGNPEPENTPPSQSKPRPSKEHKRDLFEEAMAGVTPMHSDVYWQLPKKNRSRRHRQRAEDPEMAALRRLIEEGEGFRVADTPDLRAFAKPVDDVVGGDPRLRVDEQKARLLRSGILAGH